MINWDKKIGKVMIHSGVMSPGKVKEIWEMQENGDNRSFGEIAVKNGNFDFTRLKKYLSHSTQKSSSKDGTVKIGIGMIQIGAMTSQQVEEVLELQKQGDSRYFGEIAISKNYLNLNTLNTYLSFIKNQSFC